MNQQEKILAHLKKDKALKRIILRTDYIKLSKDTDLYLSLMRAIVGQQLSIKAANTIWQRFLNLFENKYPMADTLLSMQDKHLRAAGLSFQKIGYIKNIARFSLVKTLSYKTLRKKTDEELIHYLSEIKGVGQWTAEMILMFNLNRLDVFPKDDLGIQNGMKILYNMSLHGKKEMYQRMEEIAELWRPYRSLACMYIWRLKDEKNTTESQK